VADHPNNPQGPQGPQGPWTHHTDTDQFHPACLRAYGEGVVDAAPVFAMVIQNPTGPESFSFFLGAQDANELSQGLARTLAGWN
jgi:hypothetical protein